MAVKESVIKDASGAMNAKGPKGKRDALPMAFMEWQISSRLDLLQGIDGKGMPDVKRMGAHLPVMATRSDDHTLNLASKGIGLLPKEHLLGHHTLAFREAIHRFKDDTPGSSLRKRLSYLLDLYSDPENFDRETLGGLEIFEGTTYRNLKSDPRAYLLFSGEAPSFPSYQIDGVIEFVKPGDERYEYLLAARELFAMDRFHVYQVSYPYGYVLHVRRVNDKTPFTRRTERV